MNEQQNNNTKKDKKNTFVLVDKKTGFQAQMDYLDCLRYIKKNRYRGSIQVRNLKGEYRGDGITLKQIAKLHG